MSPSTIPLSARPFVTANFAQTWDARVSTRNRTPADFSSPEDKHRLLEIRATGDAVLVGAGTVKADTMSMGLPDEALRAERVARGQSEYPLRIIVSNRGKLDPALKVFGHEFSPIHIFSTQKMPAKTRTALKEKAVLHLSQAGEVDLGAMLVELRRDFGVRRVVCEGGPTLLRALLEADLLDELHLTLCPRIFGGEEAPTLTGVAGSFLKPSTRLTLREMELHNDECYLQYRVLR